MELIVHADHGVFVSQVVLATARSENLAAPVGLLEPIDDVRAEEAGTAGGDNSSVSHLSLLVCDRVKVNGSARVLTAADESGVSLTCTAGGEVHGTQPL
jgi:hypothetical protein